MEARCPMNLPIDVLQKLWLDISNLISRSWSFECSAWNRSGNEVRNDIEALFAAEIVRALTQPSPATPTMPSLEAGDWVLYDYFGADTVLMVESAARVASASVVIRTAKEIRGERNGQPFIWRKPSQDRKET